VSGWDRRLEIASVDDFATHHDIVKLPRAQVFDMLDVTSAAQVLMAGEQPDPPSLRKPRGRLGEVLADFAAGCPLVVSGILGQPVRHSVHRPCSADQPIAAPAASATT
jgi:hypothetical protein